MHRPCSSECGIYGVRSNTGSRSEALLFTSSIGHIKIHLPSSGGLWVCLILIWSMHSRATVIWCLVTGNTSYIKVKNIQIIPNPDSNHEPDRIQVRN